MYKLALSLLFVIITFATQAQSNQFSVLYEVTELEADEVPMLSMLKGSTVEVTYGDKISKTDVNMMFGMVHLQIFADAANKESTMYFDMMGQKKYVKQPMGQAAGVSPNEMAKAAGIDNMELKKGKGKSKKIAGYKSMPYEIKGGPDGMGMTIFITKKLQAGDAGGLNFLKDLIKLPEIDGFPMMMELTTEGMSLTLEAKEVNNKIDKSTFAQPSGYEESSMEELLGGMGGGLGGFGGMEDLGVVEQDEEEDEDIDENVVDVPVEEPARIPNDDVNELYDVEVRPEFPGGEAALNKYLAENLKYPADAVAKKTEGTVIVSFIVQKDGSISDVLAIRDMPNGCTEEAIRVVKAMPKWNPGKNSNTPVKVKYTLPVKFVLK